MGQIFNLHIYRHHRRRFHRILSPNLPLFLSSSSYSRNTAKNTKSVKCKSNSLTNNFTLIHSSYNNIWSGSCSKISNHMKIHELQLRNLKAWPLKRLLKGQRFISYWSQWNIIFPAAFFPVISADPSCYFHNALSSVFLNGHSFKERKALVVKFCTFSP